MNASPKKTDIKQTVFKYLPYAVLFLAVFLLYAKTASYDVVYLDDASFIIDNSVHYNSNNIVKNIFTNNVLFGGHSSYYRPVLILSFAIGDKIARQSPHFAHLTNIMLHVFSCFMVFFFFKRYLMSRTAALAASFIFAVHPANIYTVAWIPGRNDSIFLIFFLFSLIFLIEYFNKRKIPFLILHFISFMALLFTKESAMMMPAVFTLFFLTHKDKTVKSFPAYIYISVIWAIEITVFLALRANSIPQNSILSSAVQNLNIQNLSMFFEYYASMFFLVTPFGADITLKPFLLGGAAAAITAHLAFFSGRDRLKMLFYFIVPFLVLAPTMMAQRIWYQGNRMYLPLFAVLAVCFVSFDVFYEKHKKYRKVILSAVCAFLLLCAGITYIKTEPFRNRLTFWSSVYDGTKNKSLLLQNLYADALLKFGYPDEAFPVIQKVIAENSENMTSVFNLANYYFIKGDYGKAAASFERTTDNRILADAETYANLFICSLFVGNQEAASFYYAQTAQKLGGSAKNADEFISEILKKLELTQKAYKERSIKNIGSAMPD